jgi:hypothetical protein
MTHQSPMAGPTHRHDTGVAARNHPYGPAFGIAVALSRFSGIVNGRLARRAIPDAGATWGFG